MAVLLIDLWLFVQCFSLTFMHLSRFAFNVESFPLLKNKERSPFPSFPYNELIWIKLIKQYGM